MFTNLGDRYLSGDEAWPALLGKNILKYGYPEVVSGNNLIECSARSFECLFNETLNIEIAKKDISTYPPLQYYFSASGLLLFGLNSFGARFFFAVLGILSLITLYFTVLEISKDKKKAILTIFLFSMFIPFYLYSRQSRYYSLAMFFTILSLYGFIRFINHKKYGSLIFIFSNILLFYSFYIPFLSVYLSYLLYVLLIPKIRSKYFKRFVICTIIIFIFTFPWYILNGPDVDTLSMYVKDTSKDSAPFIESAINFFSPISYIFLYVFPLFFVPITFLVYRKNTRLILPVLIICLTFLVSFLGSYGLTGLRHHASNFPLYFLLIGECFYYIIKKYKKIGYCLVLIFLFTNILNILPFIPLKIAPYIFNGDKLINDYVTENTEIRFLFFDYWHEITHEYKNPIESIVTYLNENKNEGDILLTNADISSIMFYTNITIFKEYLNEPPTWIVPRRPYYVWEGVTGNKENIVSESNREFTAINRYVISHINESYEKISLPVVDYPYLYDEAHPRPHRFRQAYFPEKKYDTYPIEIYHLKSKPIK